MAKLYFYFSAMNAGKSTVLLQSAYNYQERGMETILFKPAFDDRFDVKKISSRIGLSADAYLWQADSNLFEEVRRYQETHPKLSCVFVDEAHFLNKAQVLQLAQIVDELDLPVLTYGLRSDFEAEPFPGSQYLLVLADNLIEIKTICHCGRKAIMNVRVDATGHAVKSGFGEQVQIGGNESYTSMCRKHFQEVTRDGSKVEMYRMDVAVEDCL